MFQVISGDGAIIHYERVGSGPLAILVASMNPAVTAALAHGLVSDFSVLIYDPGPRDDAGVVADIAALIAAEGGAAYLFACAGAVLPVLEASAALPRRIRALALYQPQIDPGFSLEAPPAHWQNAIMPVLVIDGDLGSPTAAAQADWIVSGLHNGERLTLADQDETFDPHILAPLLNVFFQLGSVQVH